MVIDIVYYSIHIKKIFPLYNTTNEVIISGILLFRFFFKFKVKTSILFFFFYKINLLRVSKIGNVISKRFKF